MKLENYNLTEPELFKKEGKHRLKGKEINSLLKKISKKWKRGRHPDKLVREFKFKDFKEAIKFVNKIAKIAEKLNHHPNIHIISYKFVTLEIWTHSLDGLHKIDFILAAKIDRLH